VEDKHSFAIITFSEKYLYRTRAPVHLICMGTSYFPHDKLGKILILHLCEYGVWLLAVWHVKTIYRVIQNDCRGTIVRRQFRTKSGEQPPSDISIRRWFAQFQKTGYACIPELKVRIRTAIETITTYVLQTVWNELDYHVDVCRITNGAHVEHL